MRPKARFVQSIVEAARKSGHEMPWKRGERRAVFVARRPPAPAKTPMKAC